MPYKDIQQKHRNQLLYRLSHREEKATYDRAYRLEHVEARAKYNRAYQQSHKPARAKAARIWAERRRARKKGLLSTLTVEQWEAILHTYKHRCAYCGHRSNNLTQDHLVALSQGGPTVAHNIVPACKSCNSSKGARPAEPTAPLRLLLL